MKGRLASADIDNSVYVGSRSPDVPGEKRAGWVKDAERLRRFADKLATDIAGVAGVESTLSIAAERMAANVATLLDDIRSPDKAGADAIKSHPVAASVPPVVVARLRGLSGSRQTSAACRVVIEHFLERHEGAASLPETEPMGRADRHMTFRLDADLLGRVRTMAARHGVKPAVVLRLGLAGVLEGQGEVAAHVVARLADLRLRKRGEATCR